MLSPTDCFLLVLRPFEELKKKLEPVVNPQPEGEAQHKAPLRRPFPGRDKRNYTLTHLADEQGKSQRLDLFVELISKWVSKS